MRSLDLNQELETLRGMTVAELQRRYREVWGEDTRTHSKPHLVKTHRLEAPGRRRGVQRSP